MNPNPKSRKVKIKDGKIVQSEASIHLQVVKIIRLRWPYMLFRTDFAAGIKMEPRMAGRHSQLQKGKSWPDLFICHPVGKYCGLFLELKRDRSEVFNKDGSIVASDHIRGQDGVLKHLSGLSYRASFAFGVDHAIELIDNYLSGD